MNSQYDAIVIGAGLAGGTCARRLHDGGMRVALIERARVGGETSYWASIPSTTLLGPANLLWRMQAAAGVSSAAIAGPRGVAYRDDLVVRLSDTAQVERLRHEGIDVLKGQATLGADGRVSLDGDILSSGRIVIATGSVPRIPKIDGLAEVDYWTSRDAATFTSLPASIVIIGGEETHAVELAQMFRLYGSEVTLVTPASRLAPREDPDVGEMLAQHIHQSGVRLLTGQQPRRVTRDEQGDILLEMDDGTRVRGQRLLVAAGRAPNLAGLGLERTPIHMTAAGIDVDPYCRAAPGIWAIGDVTGSGSYVHVAQYQARIAADDMLGHAHPAHYESVPRIVFTEPQAAATGLTLAQARERGLDISSLTLDIDAPAAPEAALVVPIAGKLTLHADRSRGLLVGAWAVAPDAGDWIQLAVLAIRAAVPIGVLYDILEQFPTFSESYLHAVGQLLG